ncbi:MAG: hypothetical protein ACI4Q8_00780, partial [Ruminococcus sp.]
PVAEGDIVGKARVYYVGKGAKGKQLIGTVNLVSGETVERSGILYVLDVIKSIVSSPWFYLVIGVIVVLLIIYIIVSSVIRHRNKKRRGVRRYRNF